MVGVWHFLFDGQYLTYLTVDVLQFLQLMFDIFDIKYEGYIKASFLLNIFWKREKMKKVWKNFESKKTKRKIERREKKSLVVFADATLLKDVEPLQAGLVSSFGKSRQT